MVMLVLKDNLVLLVCLGPPDHLVHRDNQDQ